MAQKLDIRDMKRQRNKKRFRRFLKKFLVFMIIIFIGAAAYITREDWLPFFDGIASRYMSTIQNDGQLADGNFPIKLPGGAAYQSGALDNAVTVLNDTHFFVYDVDGNMLFDHQHNYFDPVMKTSSKKALLYDAGGTSFKLLSKYNVLYEKQISDNIILARLSSTDQVAVVTSTSQFVSVMTVYNRGGEEIYRWKSVEDRITDVTFTAMGGGCVVTTCNASSGELVTRLYRFDFGRAEESWQSDDMSMLGISTAFFNDGSLIVFGDTQCATVSSDGTLLSEYVYPSEMAGYGAGSDFAALLLQNQQRRKSTVVFLESKSLTELSQAVVSPSVSGGAKRMAMSGSAAMVLTANSVDAYSKQGALVATANVNAQYYSFQRIANHIFLIGAETIDRIDFSG